MNHVGCGSRLCYLTDAMVYRMAILLMVSVLAALALGAARDNPRGFEGPRTMLEAATTLKPVEEQLMAGKGGRAGEVEALLRDHLDDLASTEGGVISAYAWLEGLPAPAWKTLCQEYQQRFDADARRALERVRSDGAARPEDYVAVGRRCLPSSVAMWAFVEAGDRAIALGDAMAAESLYARAERLGWKSDEDRVLTSAVGRMLAGQPAGKLPPGMAQRLGKLPEQLGEYRGPVAFDALWLQRPALPRFFPVAGDGVIYLSSVRQVMAIKNARVLWRWASDEAWVKSFGPEQMAGRGGGQSFGPAVFWSATGAGQIVVVRHGRGGAGDYCLRAFRAEDGKLLWGTDTNTTLDGLSFSGLPTVAGRYVYSMAVDFAQGAQLTVVALDVMSGQAVFKTQLGSIPQLVGRRENASMWEAFWEPCTVAADGLELFIAPNVGFVFSVGRVDGKIRWMRNYKETLGRGAPPRWGNIPVVCGRVVVVAPTDGDTLMGLDRMSGAIVWSSDTMSSATLVGGSGQTVVLAGASVSGIEAETGKVRWQYEPPRPNRISGVATVVGGTVYVPTSDSHVVTLAAEDGKATDSGPKHPNFRQVVAGESTRRMLDEAGILQTIGVPRN